MNIFLLSLNSPPEYLHKTLENLDLIYDIYPELCDGKRFFYKSSDLRNYVLSLHQSPGYIGARNYLAENIDSILLYSGLPIDPAERIQAHRAEEFLDRFDELKYDFEGQAALIRFNKLTNNVDIVTDNLGLEQVYYYNQNGTCLLSNNLNLIENVTGSLEIDPVGASLMVSTGWVTGDYTLRKGIKLIRGGQHWIWNNREKLLSKKTYFDPSEINTYSDEVLNKRSIKVLKEEMARCYVSLGKYFDLDCPLTGGYDSRLVTAFLLDKKLKANYYTIGNPEHGDAKIAAMIAEKFNLPYSVYQIDYENLFQNWFELTRKFILQTSGIASLWGINGMLIRANHESLNNKLTVRLSTEGAETTRGHYSHYNLWNGKTGKEDVYNHLLGIFLQKKYGMLSEISIKYFSEYFTGFFKNFSEKGVDFKSFPDFLLLFDRVSRFHGNNRSIYKNYSDPFSVFCTKAYLTTAFKLHPLKKFSYPIHYKLMKLLNVELMKMPNIHGTWPIRNLHIKILATKAKPFLKKYISSVRTFAGMPQKVKLSERAKVPGLQIVDRLGIVETKLDEIKGICFDQTNSEIWQFINKGNLENILLGKIEIGEPELFQLYSIITLFYSEYFSKEKRGSKKSKIPSLLN